MADKLYDRQGKKLLKRLIPYSTLFFSRIRPPHLDTSHYLLPGGGGTDDLGLNKAKFSRSLPKLGCYFTEVIPPNTTFDDFPLIPPKPSFSKHI